MSILAFLDDYLLSTALHVRIRRPGPIKYMLLIYFDKQALSETERQACYVESTQLAHEIKSSGQYLAANPLHPTAMATAVACATANVS